MQLNQLVMEGGHDLWTESNQYLQKVISLAQDWARHLGKQHSKNDRLTSPAQIKCTECQALSEKGHWWNTQNQTASASFFYSFFIFSFYLTKVEEVKCFGLWRIIHGSFISLSLMFIGLSVYTIFLICSNLIPLMLCAGLGRVFPVVLSMLSWCHSLCRKLLHSHSCWNHLCPNARFCGLSSCQFQSRQVCRWIRIWVVGNLR